MSIKVASGDKEEANGARGGSFYGWRVYSL